MSEATRSTEAEIDKSTSRWRVYGLLIAATLLYCPLLFADLENHGRIDWDQFSFRYESPRVALLRDQQVPLWNPYANGGTVLLAHPDCPFPSPWYLLVLAFGAPLGLRLQVLLFMLLGTTGMAALLGRWKVGDAGRFVAGVVLMMSSHFALHIAEGHLEWCVLGLMPWLVICLLRIPQDPKWIVLAALLLASVLTFGSVYIMAVYTPFLTVWAVLESLRNRNGRFVAAWVVVLTLTACLSAVKLFPQLEFVQANPREVQREGLSVSQFGRLLLDYRTATLYKSVRDSRIPRSMSHLRGIPQDVAAPILKEYSQWRDERTFQGFLWSWHEYGCYITYAGLVLAACGLIIGWRQHWPLYVSGIGAACVVMGSGAPIDFWRLFQQLPLYESLQVPSRFLCAVVFVLAVASGVGMHWLLGRLSKINKGALPAIVGFAVPAVIYVELAMMGWSLFGDIFVCPPLETRRYETFATRYQDVGSVYYPVMSSYLTPRLEGNSGVLSGYENISVQQGDVRVVGEPGYRGEAYFDPPTSGTAAIENWAMSRVVVDVQVGAPTTLLLNQNFFVGWNVRIDGVDGTRKQSATKSASGLVSVEIRPGDRAVEFYFLPSSFLWGIAVSVVSLVGCAGFLVYRQRSRQ